MEILYKLLKYDKMIKFNNSSYGELLNQLANYGGNNHVYFEKIVKLLDEYEMKRKTSKEFFFRFLVYLIMCSFFVL